MANCKDEPLKSYFEQLNPNERRVQAEIINQIEITIPSEENTQKNRKPKFNPLSIPYNPSESSTFK